MRIRSATCAGRFCRLCTWWLASKLCWRGSWSLLVASPRSRCGGVWRSTGAAKASLPPRQYHAPRTPSTQAQHVSQLVALVQQEVDCQAAASRRNRATHAHLDQQQPAQRQEAAGRALSRLLAAAAALERCGSDDHPRRRRWGAWPHLWVHPSAPASPTFRWICAAAPARTRWRAWCSSCSVTGRCWRTRRPAAFVGPVVTTVPAALPAGWTRCVVAQFLGTSVAPRKERGVVDLRLVKACCHALTCRWQRWRETQAQLRRALAAHHVALREALGGVVADRRRARRRLGGRGAPSAAAGEEEPTMSFFPGTTSTTGASVTMPWDWGGSDDAVCRGVAAPAMAASAPSPAPAPA